MTPLESALLVTVGLLIVAFGVTFAAWCGASDERRHYYLLVCRQEQEIARCHAEVDRVRGLAKRILNIADEDEPEPCSECGCTCNT